MKGSLHASTPSCLNHLDSSVKAQMDVVHKTISKPLNDLQLITSSKASKSPWLLKTVSLSSSLPVLYVSEESAAQLSCPPQAQCGHVSFIRGSFNHLSLIWMQMPSGEDSGHTDEKCNGLNQHQKSLHLPTSFSSPFLSSSSICTQPGALEAAALAPTW